jgi:hypothetical protein
VRLTANEVRCKSLQEFKSPRLRSIFLLSLKNMKFTLDL